MDAIVEQLKIEVSKKVIEEIPTLGKFQEKEELKQRPVLTDATGGSQHVVVSEANPRKSIFFPGKNQDQ
jgi:hypothetical protein